ncbi:type IV secretion system protein [Aurantiacibacter arachoides]|nr:type IV secretion system protein [Aurantiacibacter arachoides]
MEAVAAECQRQMEGVGAGIGASLRGVDCAANAMAQAAFSNLFSNGALGTTLTLALTIFVAFVGFGMLTGRTGIGLSSLTPKMMTVALVVTFATSWVAFQAVFWNFAVLTPDFIASAVMGTSGSAATLFADKLDVVMLSLMQASGGDAMDANTSVFSPPGLLWSGGTMLLLGTVGVLATTKIALAILMGLGPIFILAALFKPTRGLFTGWLKGVVLMALAPLFAVLGGSLMLELSIPVLSSLGSTPEEIDVRAAMAFFMIGAIHLALMFMVMKVTSTMVAGWNVFGLAPAKRGEAWPAMPAAAAAASTVVTPALAGSSARERTAQAVPPAAARDMRVVRGAMPVAANDSGSAATNRETRIVSTRETGGAAGSAGAAPSRARGIGSRFKSAPIRQKETLK